MHISRFFFSKFYLSVIQFITNTVVINLLIRIYSHYFITNFMEVNYNIGLY